MTISLSWLSTLFYITIRLGTLLLLSPVQALRQMPVPARLLFVFIFSLLLVNFLPNVNQVDTHNLLLGSLAEFANGLILSISLYAAFATFHIAGQLIDNASGLNSITIFDPHEHSQTPLCSQLVYLLVGLFFFAMDGHVWMFKGLAYSFVIIPPGQLNLFSGLEPVIKEFAFAFSMGFIIASPIVLALLIIDLCGAFITRNIPQVSTYFLTLPIKIILGLALFSMILTYINPISTKIFEGCFATWQGMMS